MCAAVVGDTGVEAHDLSVVSGGLILDETTMSRSEHANASI